jgi:hypothetical protein
LSIDQILSSVGKHANDTKGYRTLKNGTLMTLILRMDADRKDRMWQREPVLSALSVRPSTAAQNIGYRIFVGDNGLYTPRNRASQERTGFQDG